MNLEAHRPATIRRPCLAPGCGQDRGTNARFCHTHYMRMHRTGRLDLVPYGKTGKMNDIGRNIYALRIRDGLKTREVAARCGLSWPTIWHISTGSGTNLDTLRSIAAAFNVQVWELLKPDHFPLVR